MATKRQRRSKSHPRRKHSAITAPKPRILRPLAHNAFAYTVQDALTMGLTSRRRLYDLIGDGSLVTKHLGKRPMILGWSLRKLFGLQVEGDAEAALHHEQQSGKKDPADVVAQ